MRQKAVKNDTDFWDSARLNRVALERIDLQFAELAMSMFEWTGLPDSIDTRWLEWTLYRDGACVFFYDNELGEWVVMRCDMAGHLGIYDVPTNYRAYSVNGYSRQLTDQNSVLIWNNFAHTPSFPMMHSYALDIWQAERAAVINANAQKTPILLLCNDSDKLTLENLYMKYDGNAPVIKGIKDRLEENPIKTITTGAPFVAQQLLDFSANMYEKAIRCLGITSSSGKKERLLAEEASALSGSVVAARYSRLAMREQAAKKMSKISGLNIEVKYRPENLETFAYESGTPKEGGETKNEQNNN